MSQFDLNQLSKKNQEFIRIAKHQLLENGNQRKKQKASSKKSFQLSMKTKEKGFRHGLFLELQLFGRILSARKNAMKKSIRN